jgi:hypothetical protein
MRRLLRVTFDCEIFITQTEGFIAQSEDLSLNHVSFLSQLIETETFRYALIFL